MFLFGRNLKFRISIKCLKIKLGWFAILYQIDKDYFSNFLKSKKYKFEDDDVFGGASDQLNGSQADSNLKILLDSVIAFYNAKHGIDLKTSHAVSVMRKANQRQPEEF